jgi:GNAT superfamily N-acetyltransferase
MTVRDATSEDAESVAALLAELGYPSDADFARQRILDYTTCPTSAIVIAEVEHEIRGFLAFDSQPLFHQDGNIGCIMALCVASEARGGGVGRALVNRVEEIAKALGCTKIAVASGLQRVEAHSFYRGLGYKEITKRFVKQLC